MLHIIWRIFVWGNVFSLGVAVIALIWTVIARPDRIQAILILIGLGAVMGLTYLLGLWWEWSFIITAIVAYIVRDQISKISGLSESQPATPTPAA